MPRFKATPKRDQATLQESDSRSDAEVSSDELNDVFPEDEGRTRREQLLRKLVSIAQHFVGKLANISTHSVRNLDTAIILAQAAAFAAFTAEPSTLSAQRAHPPIAPLGLSLENPRILQPRTDLSKQTTLVSISTTTQTVSQDTFETVAVPTAPESKEAISSSKPTVTCAVQTVEFGSTDNYSDSNEKPSNVYGIIPLAAPEYDDPLSRRKNLGVAECEVCHKVMKRGSLREHMEMHNNSGKFKCDKCPKTFSRASAREKHVRTHTGEKPFVCEYCSKAYRQRIHLNEHLRSHTGLRPFVCRLCGFSVASKSLLNRHLGTHGVNRQLPDGPELWFKSDAPRETVLNLAAEAGRVLSAVNLNADTETTNGYLSSHPASATEKSAELPKGRISNDIVLSGRKYLCNSCPAGFPTIQALRSHRVTTHGRFPHKCPECEESFTSLNSRDVHLRERHPQVCPICSKVMPQRRLHCLHAHMREAHPNYGGTRTTSQSSVHSSRTLRSGSKRPSTANEKDELSQWKHFKEGDPGSRSSGADCESEFSSNRSSVNESDPASKANDPVLTENGIETLIEAQSVPEPDAVLIVVGCKEADDEINDAKTSDLSSMEAEADSDVVVRTDDVSKSTFPVEGVNVDKERSISDAIADEMVDAEREIIPTEEESL